MSILPVPSGLTKFAIGALVVAGAAGGMFVWGHHVGYTGEKAIYDKYVSDQKIAADEQKAANKNALAQQAAEFQMQMAAIEKDRTDAITHLTNQRDAALADRDRSAGQLRAFLARTDLGPEVSGPAASGSGDHAAGQVRRIDGVSFLNQWLIERLGQCDVDAANLTTAQQVIAKDRETCNGHLPGVN